MPGTYMDGSSDRSLAEFIGESMGSPASLGRPESESHYITLPISESRECLYGQSSAKGSQLRIISKDENEDVYTISADRRTTEIKLRALETTLPGRLLLRSFTGTHSWELSAWLSPSEWGNGDFRVNSVGPPSGSRSPQYTICGGAELLLVSQTVLEENWAGRLFIIGWTPEYSTTTIVAFVSRDIIRWGHRVATRFCRFLVGMLAKIWPRSCS